MSRSRVFTMAWRWSGIAAFAPYIAVVRAFSPAHVECQTGRSKAGDWDAARYSKNAGFVPELGKHVLDLLAPRTGERILDVGCGDGVLTAELKAKGCRVIGIDFAPDMVAAAVKRELEAYVMDATAIDAPFLLSKISDSPPPSGQQPQSAAPEITAAPSSSFSSSTPTTTSSFPAPARLGVTEVGDDSCRDSVSGPVEGSPAYDAVFTNAALHWVRAPRAVVDGAKRVLRPGGRFVGEFGGHGNMAAVRVAMHSALWRRGVDPSTVDPWYFPTAEEYRTLLEEAGFIVDDVTLVARPTILPAGTGMRGWLSTFTPAFINAVPHKEETETSASGSKDSHGLTPTAAIVLDEALASLQPALCDKNGIWTADYVRLRFRAHLPEDCSAGTVVDNLGGGGGAKGSGW